MSDEAGSAAVLVLSVVAVAVLLAALLGDVGALLAGRSRAQTAADAAALAAAPVTFRHFGARGSPRHEAALFAAANGAELTRCSCRVDRSFRPREVEVEVTVLVRSVLLGERSVRASGRALFDPTRLAPSSSGARWSILQPR